MPIILRPNCLRPRRRGHHGGCRDRGGNRRRRDRAIAESVRHALCRPADARRGDQGGAGSRAQGWLAQGRSEVLARHGIVATSDPLAAQAGLEILRQGGNAIDAAVATGAVLDVTSQNDTGIGGDLFALVWVGQRQEALRAELRRVGAGRLDAASSSPSSWA